LATAATGASASGINRSPRQTPGKAERIYAWLLCSGNPSTVFLELLTLLLYAIVPVVVSACFVGALAKLIVEAAAGREILGQKRGNN
jgi:hypothetical protein